MMVRVFVFLFLLAGSAASLFSQETAVEDDRVLIHGLLVQQYGGSAVVSAHVLNTSNGRGTLSEQSGKFDLIATPGDSLRITAIGFFPIEFKLKPKTADVLDTVFVLQVDTVSLEAVPIMGRNRWNEFKDDFTAMPVAEDTLQVQLPLYGPAHVAPSSGSGVVVSGAITEVYKYFSVYGTQHRKMRRARKQLARQVMEVDKNGTFEEETDEEPGLLAKP